MLERLTNIGVGPKIQTRRLYLRAPKMSDWQAWASLRSESRHFLVPWEPVWTADTLSKANYRVRMRRYSRDARDDLGHAFFIFQQNSHQIVGGVTLSNIRRGISQTGTLGYWTGQRFARHGYMFEALCGLIPTLFDRYGLRRIEAACLPENIPSSTLLDKVGFSREGVAREYLCINGVWHDHLVYAFLNGDTIAPRRV